MLITTSKHDQDTTSLTGTILIDKQYSSVEISGLAGNQCYEIYLEAETDKVDKDGDYDGAGPTLRSNTLKLFVHPFTNDQYINEMGEFTTDINHHGAPLVWLTTAEDDDHVMLMWKHMSQVEKYTVIIR